MTSPSLAETTELTVINLLAVVRTSETESETTLREFQSVEECKKAEAAMHEAANAAINVIDVGTICVKSEFLSGSKPKV